jgi:hypothetical protein
MSRNPCKRGGFVVSERNAPDAVAANCRSEAGQRGSSRSAAPVAATTFGAQVYTHDTRCSVPGLLGCVIALFGRSLKVARVACSSNQPRASLYVATDRVD